MNRIPFLAINLAIAFIFAPIAMAFLPDNMGSMDDADFATLPLAARLVFEVHNFVLIPAFIKRMKDIDFAHKKIEVILALIYVPAVLRVFASNSLMDALHIPLSIAGMVLLLTNIFLFLKEGTQAENRYGAAPKRPE